MKNKPKTLLMKVAHRLITILKEYFNEEGQVRASLCSEIFGAKLNLN